MELTRKKASIESYDAYSDRNRLCFETFFADPVPIGIKDVPRKHLIDIDEAKFSLKQSQTRYGYAGKPYRVRDTGHYSKKVASVNLILAVKPGNSNLPDHMRGSTGKPRKWFMITTKNLDQHVFADFLESIIRDIDEHPVEGDDERIFIWDNHSAHLTDIVINTLEARPGPRRFVAVPRPPYQPKVAPVEYAFCMIATALCNQIQRSWTLPVLRRQLHNVVMSLGFEGKMNRTFAHCGYD